MLDRVHVELVVPSDWINNNHSSSLFLLLHIHVFCITNDYPTCELKPSNQKSAMGSFDRVHTHHHHNHIMISALTPCGCG